MIHYIYLRPLWVICLYIVLLLLLFTIGNFVFRKKYQLFWKILNLSMLVGSVSAILYLTLLNRSYGENELILVPFYSFVEARLQPEAYRVLLMNIFLFVPLGLTLANVLPKKCKHPIGVTIVAGSLISVLVELAQYVFSIGRCEVDDVIANTVGTCIGCLSLVFSRKMVDIYSNKKNMKVSNENSSLDYISRLLLGILSHELFDGVMPDVHGEIIDDLFKEARAQSVFPIVYTALKRECGDSEKLNEYKKLYMAYVISFAQNSEEHNELHGLMNKWEIPYCVLKGVSSLSYYKKSVLRTVGDVDFLVYPKDVDKTAKVLEDYGFVKKESEAGDIHFAFNRGGFSVWELHYSINGIPESDIGTKIYDDVQSIIGASRTSAVSDICCCIPSPYHHGLIMILHMISHLTSEGIGLRHLCDWAVFVDSFSEEEFEISFKDKFIEYGIWRFSQIITMVCVEYLGIKPQKWAQEVIDNEMFSKQDLEALVLDIIAGGNFGKKDMNRCREIKYISNKTGSVDEKNVIIQLFISLNNKVYDNYSFVKRFKVLLPVGWCIEAAKYMVLLVSGKRKSTDNTFMLREASKRKRIYSKMKLFEE